MNTRFLTTLAAACICVLMMTSCATSLERRLEKNPEIFARLTESEKNYVRMGMIKEGMGKDAVFLAWGRPARVASGLRNGKTFERWSYMEYEPVYFTNFSVGFGYGCFHDPFIGMGPSVDYVPVPGKAVEFSNGKVIGYLIPR